MGDRRLDIGDSLQETVDRSRMWEMGDRRWVTGDGRQGMGGGRW